MKKITTIIILLLIIIFSKPGYARTSAFFSNVIGNKINNCEIIDVRYVQETHGSSEKYAFVCLDIKNDGTMILKEFRFYDLEYEADLSAEHVFELLNGRDINVRVIKDEWDEN